MTEQLLELGVTPIAMSDKTGYTDWVGQPALPDSVEDLGTRAEPNLEKMANLKPDLLLVSNVDEPIIQRLEAIAPVVTFKTFSKSHNNAERSIEIFRRLSVLFQQQSVAEVKLASMQQNFHHLKEQLLVAYQDELPQVTTVRFANPSSVYIYGDNSMSQYALEQLGITNALPQPTSKWGLVQKRTLLLSKIHDGAVLYFEPFPQSSRLNQSRLWQAMPFVRKGNTNAIASTWTYGGAMSLNYLAEAMTASLLAIAPENRRAD
ncbi:iron-siderophore ABC transporter substrate-binding protein [Endozoicomonas ascidiicola]|uniref:iron-siderophore ABC transporter substrate-binding protein n=1 Tax=Endozoicomonas ascidiicola TaxID=1698521 RepID=UPI000AB1BB74|nr:iron-siderophore ABC transporter substrate-binding protein [Endozoicomonas ascidiicola]